MGVWSTVSFLELRRKMKTALKNVSWVFLVPETPQIHALGRMLHAEGLHFCLFLSIFGLIGIGLRLGQGHVCKEGVQPASYGGSERRLRERSR